MNGTDYVKASEIQEYIYCKRAWWLKLHGKVRVTEQMTAGTLAHESMARSVTRQSRITIALYFIFVALIFLIVLYVIISSIFGL